ncbi:hypothetical protein ABEX69_11200 [Bacillus safensis]|uniref:hypothetical protein n=1 Tax=Bacillus safensis TaxID=561879 RepID=UPI0022381903|nr:hypothetical protein [Bacillus safensis]MCW4644228.1 hypothetical protein [Bacillus safensis]MCY7564861.1 hypothetical protein [Bacillus safensis]MCY7625654.1 hypothetical protein [Bacillus safensis]MCY7635091.1 hypothetical protein [Bacillus safensis]MCY7648366.1 hypothetical protein [Bacillus safensis]
MGTFIFVIILVFLGAIIANQFTSKDKRASANRSAHHSSTTSTYSDSYTHHASDAFCGSDSGDSAGGGCD